MWTVKARISHIKRLDFVQGTATEQIFQRVLGLKVRCRNAYSGYGKDSSLVRVRIRAK